MPISGCKHSWRASRQTQDPSHFLDAGNEGLELSNAPAGPPTSLDPCPAGNLIFADRAFFMQEAPGCSVVSQSGKSRRPLRVSPCGAAIHSCPSGSAGSIIPAGRLIVPSRQESYPLVVGGCLGCAAWKSTAAPPSTALRTGSDRGRWRGVDAGAIIRVEYEAVPHCGFPPRARQKVDLRTFLAPAVRHSFGTPRQPPLQ